MILSHNNRDMKHDKRDYFYIIVTTNNTLTFHKLTQ